MHPGRLQQGIQPLGDAEAEEQADHGTDQADDDRLEHNRPEHLPAGGAEGAQRRQLADALSDRDSERVRDHEGADEERDAAEPEYEVAEALPTTMPVLSVGRP